MGWPSGQSGAMTPDDRPGEEPTRPLPVDPEQTETGPTQPLIASHVPVADIATAPLDPVEGVRRRSDGPRALTWGLIAAVVLLGIAVIVVLTLYFQGRDPAPVLSPLPSSSPTVTIPPSEGPSVDVPQTPEDDSGEPTTEPTTPPEPTDPPDPDPTETPASEAPAS